MPDFYVRPLNCPDRTFPPGHTSRYAALELSVAAMIRPMHEGVLVRPIDSCKLSGMLKLQQVPQFVDRGEKGSAVKCRRGRAAVMGDFC